MLQAAYLAGMEFTVGKFIKAFKLVKKIGQFFTSCCEKVFLRATKKVIERVKSVWSKNSCPNSTNNRFKKSEWKAPSGSGTGQSYRVYQQEIDWNLKVNGRTNAERAINGQPPFIMKNGKPQQIQLHHSRQDARGPIFEVSRSTHLQTKSGHGKEALHPFGRTKHPDFPVDHSAFGIDRKNYWIDRAAAAGYYH